MQNIVICLVLTTPTASYAASDNVSVAKNVIPDANTIERTNTDITSEKPMEEVRVYSVRERGPLPLDANSRTGSRLDLAIRDQPASISVVTQDVIQARGARTATEAIQSAVGMTAVIGTGSIPNYGTRGFTGNDITVMRDGIRQNTISQSGRPLDSFLFDRIEVLKGPASLLYGEGAIGGAVNYVSKQATKMPEAEINISAGPWSTYRGSAGAGGSTGINNLYFRADASTSSSNGYVDRSDYEYKSAAGELKWEVSDQTSLAVAGTFLKDSTKSYYGTPVVYDAIINQSGIQSVAKANTSTDSLVNPRIVEGTEHFNYNIKDNFANAENSFLRATLDTRLSDHWSLRNEAYAVNQHLNWRNIESNVWNPVTNLVDRGSFFLIYRDDLQLGNRLDITWNAKLAGHTNKLLIGALYDHNDQLRNSGQTYTTSASSVSLFDPDVGYGLDVGYEPTVKIVTRMSAVYFEDAFDITDNAKLVSGLRYDHIEVKRTSLIGTAPYEKSYNPITGRVGLIYSVTPSSNIYATYSRAAQPVSQLNSLTISQNDFGLQKGRQYEVGFKASFLDNKADLTFALFDIEKNDLLTSDIINGVRVNSQIGAQISQGAELATSFAPVKGLQLDGNIAWTWIAEYKDFYENLGTGVISRDGNTTPNVPKLIVGLFASEAWRDWTVAGGLRYISEREANNNNGIQLAAYTTVDASISYQYQHLTTTLRGRNLTDKTYVESAYGSGLMWRLGEPRSGELSFRYQF